MRIFLSFIVLLAFTAVPMISHAAHGDGGGVEAGYKKPCKSCRNKGLSKISARKKGGKGGRSYSCPQGHGHVNRYCPALEKTIAKVLGSNVKCWSNLFGVEGGCSATVRHDPKKAHNPHEGIGICAIETSPLIRRYRGPACQNIKGMENQMRCCRSLMTTTHGRYFGTVGCGNVPRCS